VAIKDEIGKRIFKQRRTAMAYKTLFNLEDQRVRYVLRDMCDAHGVFDGGFDPDPNMNAFNSGERNVVLRILHIIKADLNDILNLTEE
jgi:hypothetical protein